MALSGVNARPEETVTVRRVLGADLAHQGEAGIRGQRGPEQLVGCPGAVELSGVEVIDALAHGPAQHAEGDAAVGSRAAGQFGQLYGAEADAGHRAAGEERDASRGPPAMS